MEVIVAEDQLSLAIGKRGQNVRLASKLVGWNLDIKSEAEKKAEVEAEMERMSAATQALSNLPDIEPEVASALLEAGFRTVEEVSLASMEDLTGIDGIDEETAIAIHDAAEEALEQLALQAAAEEAAAAEAAEAAAEEGDDEEELEAAAGDEVEQAEEGDDEAAANAAAVEPAEQTDEDIDAAVEETDSEADEDDEKQA
jgi:N utilization substance protein A